MVVDLLVSATADSTPIMENATPNVGMTSPPSPPSTLTAPSVTNVAMSSRSPSSLNLKGFRSLDEAARSSVASFAHQQAPLIAAMFAQRLIHVSNQTGVDIDVLHSHFVGEFLPSFLECLHSSMIQSSSSVPADCCDMCNELGQRATFLATCQFMPPQQQLQQQQQRDGLFQQRSNSVSFGSRGKNSPPLSFNDNSPCNSSLLASSLHTTSIYSLNNAPHVVPNNHNGSAVGSKIKNFIGHFVNSRRRRTISTTNNRDGNAYNSSSDNPGLSSPALSLPVDVVIEGLLELHTRGPGSSQTTSSRSGLSNSRDLLTSIPQHSEIERDDDGDATVPNVDLSKSSEFLSDSPWLPCHVRLLRSSAGPLLVLSYPPDSNLPPCGISMSSISEVRAATIGDALTSDDHAFILISSSLSSRVLLKASSRADMNRWLDALRPCVAFHPVAMVPLFPVNKFGLAIPGASGTNTGLVGNGLLAARYGGNLLGNLVGHYQQPDSSSTKSSFGNSAGAADSLSHSSSFVGRRRIQTSPAVDLQLLFKNNKGLRNGGMETDAASAVSATASDIGGSRASSTDATSLGTPPRPLSPSSQCSHTGSSQTLSSGSSSAARPLNTFPWYWGNVSRTEAAEVVCKFGESGTGCFVIRQSESQLGDYVITFNCDGEAKHLRLKVFPDGRCQMNQYAFPSVQALVDHFRTNALPIDLGASEFSISGSSLNNGVMLTNYVSRRPMTPQSAVKG